MMTFYRSERMGVENTTDCSTIEWSNSSISFETSLWIEVRRLMNQGSPGNVEFRLDYLLCLDQ